MTDYDEKEQEDAAQAEDEKNDAAKNEPAEAPDAVDEKAVTVVEPSEVTKGSSTGILQEALVQLKKLSALREQELERQEQLINQMQAVVGRHSRTNKALLAICLVTLVFVGVLSFALIKMSSGQSDATQGLNDVTANVDAALDLMRQQSNEELRKIDALQSSVSTKLVDSVDAMRRERDEIKTEVRTAIDAHDLNMRNREVALKDEEERIAKDAEVARQDRLKIISDAIDRLSKIANELEADDGGSVDSAKESKVNSEVPEALLAEEPLNAQSQDTTETLESEATAESSREVDASREVSASGPD
jgi:hypothetical protein